MNTINYFHDYFFDYSMPIDKDGIGEPTINFTLSDWKCLSEYYWNYGIFEKGVQGIGCGKNYMDGDGEGEGWKILFNEYY